MYKYFILGILLLTSSCSLQKKENATDKLVKYLYEPILEIDSSYTPFALGTKSFYLDPVNGNDSSDGSEGTPFKTFDGLWPNLKGGEIVYLMEGEYSDFDVRELKSRDQWVSFLPYQDHKPVLGKMTFFAWDGISETNYNGTYNYNLDFIGLHLSDGVHTFNVKDLWFRGCAVTRRKPLVGTVENISKTAFLIESSAKIGIENCDITHTANGIRMTGELIQVLDSHIHHITHDGIQIVGAHNVLIQGNRIHNADDGVDDDSGYEWNRHNDGIHIYLQGQIKDWTLENTDLIIRSNIIYNINGQGIMMNNYDYENNGFQTRRLLVENNIFGPTASPLFHNSAAVLEKLTFRHNSCIDFGQEGRSFTGAVGRVVQCDYYQVTFNTETTDLQVYNNIFVGNCDIPSSAQRRDHNLMQTSRYGTISMGKGSLLWEGTLFENSAALDGKLVSSAPAINGGTRLSQNWQSVDTSEYLDFYGNPRDNLPDMGSYEEQGNTPNLEQPLVLDTDLKTVFMDDFNDGDLFMDLWLDGPGIQGLSWVSSDEYKVQAITIFNDSLGLSPPVGANGGSIILSEQGSEWDDYTLEFRATTYLNQSDGPVVLAQDEDNYYWFDIARATGRLVRVVEGRETLLIQDDRMRLPNGVASIIVIKIEHQLGGGINFQVQINDEEALNYTDTDSVSDYFLSGRIGFHRYVTDSDSHYHRILVDDVRVNM